MPGINLTYSVTTAYHLLMHDLPNRSHLQEEGDQLLIWKIKAPHRIKNFLWRACRDCFPSWSQLCRRGVLCSLTCTLCETQIENLWHLFVQCSSSVECWEEQQLWGHLSNITLRVNNFKDICFLALKTLDAEQRGVLLPPSGASGEGKITNSGRASTLHPDR